MDELVKSLRKMQSVEYCVITSVEDFPAIRIVQEAADAIEELQTYADLYKDLLDRTQIVARELIEKFPKWIPVTERLPYPGDKVILAIRDESGDTRYDYTNIGWWSGYDYKFVVEDEFCSWVTHWMPLPEPPKEEQDGT